MTNLEITSSLLVMSGAAFACRVGGFILAKYIRVDRRMESAMAVLPLAVMIGILAPALAGGGALEAFGVFSVIALVRFGLNQVLAASAGVVLVAVGRMIAG